MGTLWWDAFSAPHQSRATTPPRSTRKSTRDAARDGAAALTEPTTE